MVLPQTYSGWTDSSYGSASSGGLGTGQDHGPKKTPINDGWGYQTTDDMGNPTYVLSDNAQNALSMITANPTDYLYSYGNANVDPTTRYLMQQLSPDIAQQFIAQNKAARLGAPVVGDQTAQGYYNALRGMVQNAYGSWQQEYGNQSKNNSPQAFIEAYKDWLSRMSPAGPNTGPISTGDPTARYNNQTPFDAWLAANTSYLNNTYGFNMDQNQAFQNYLSYVQPQLSGEQYQALSNLGTDVYSAYQNYLSSRAAGDKGTPNPYETYYQYLYHNQQNPLDFFNSDKFKTQSDQNPNAYFQGWVSQLGNLNPYQREALQNDYSTVYGNYVTSKAQDPYSNASFSQYLTGLNPQNLLSQLTPINPTLTYQGYLQNQQNLTPAMRNALEPRLTQVLGAYYSNLANNPSQSFEDFLNNYDIMSQLNQVPANSPYAGVSRLASRVQYLG